MTSKWVGVAAVYTATLLLAVMFGMLPALSTVLTGPDGFGLSPTAYGLLFVPQAIVAIAVASSETIFIRRVGLKSLMLAGLIMAAVSMALLLAADLASESEVTSYVTLLGSSLCVGIAFGLGVPACITLAGDYFPQRRDRAVLYLNGSVAFGPGIAPILVALAVALGGWPIAPIVLLVAVVVVFLVGSPRPLAPEPEATRPPPATGASVDAGRAALPTRFWFYMSFMLLYGIVQTTNGNWTILYMTGDIGATAAQGGLALTVFWVSLGIGRLLFGSLDRVLPEVAVFRVLPFVAAAALVLVALIPSGDVRWAIAARQWMVPVRPDERTVEDDTSEALRAARGGAMTHPFCVANGSIRAMPATV